MSNPSNDALTQETNDQAETIRQQIARLLDALPTAKTLTRASAAVALQKIAAGVTRLANAASKAK